MTIAERKAREAYDRANPWLPLSKMSPEFHGRVCELRMTMFSAPQEMGFRRYFFDGEHWYQINPPRQLSPYEAVVEFRPRGPILPPARQRSVIEQSDGKYEYRGGKLFKKPKRYKLFWRADDA